MKNSISVPPIESLTHNYRTHQCILDLAATLVDLMVHFFPSTIDRLPREESPERGDPAVLICDLSAQAMVDLLLEDFRQKASSTKSSNCSNCPQAESTVNNNESVYDIDTERAHDSPLGANQVILVGHAYQKAEVRKLFGQGTLVLTCREVKGLEFNDVLLWNVSKYAGGTAFSWLHVYEFL